MSSIIELMQPDVPIVPDPEPKPVCRDYPQCERCPYPAHGFVCWGDADNCMRKQMDRIQKGGKNKRE